MILKKKTVQGAVRVLHNALNSLHDAVDAAQNEKERLIEEDNVLQAKRTSVNDEINRGNRIIVRLAELLD